MKEEDEWDSPHIVRFLEALSDEEIEKIKELAKPNVSVQTLDGQTDSIEHRSLTGGPGPDPKAVPHGPGPTAKI